MGVKLIYLSMSLQIFVRPWQLFQFLDIFTQTVGLFDGGSARRKAATCTQGRTDLEETHTDIHASNGIRTHDPSVRAGEDGSCLRPRGHCDRRVWNLVSEIKERNILVDWECLRTGCWGEYLDRREMKWQEVGENYIMRSFITCTLLQV
jgi:hypothetical protein